MAIVGPKILPFYYVVEDLIEELASPPEDMSKLKADYLDKFCGAAYEEIQKEVCRYLTYTLLCLYEDNVEYKDADIARIVMGGRPDVVKFTLQEQHAVACMLLDTCKQLYGDEILSRL